MKRQRSFVILAMLLSLVLTACKTSEISLKEEESQVELQFSWWGNEEKNNTMLEIIREFEQKYPNIRVNAEYGEWDMASTRFPIKIKSKTEADVMQIDYSWLYEYSNYGDGFYDLAGVSDSLSMDSFSENVISSGISGGIQNGLPTSVVANVFVYNQNVLDAYGISAPGSWEELTAAARVMQKDKIYPIVLSNEALWYLAVSYAEQENGNQIFNDNGTLAFTEKDFESMLELTETFLENKVIPNLKGEVDGFFDGTAAGMVCWSGEAGGLEEKMESAGNLILGTYPIKNGATRSGWYKKPASLYAISTHSDAPTEAALFMDYLLNEEAAVESLSITQGVPASSKAVEIPRKSESLTGLTSEADELVAGAETYFSHPSFDNEKYIDAFIRAAESVENNNETTKNAALFLYHEIKSLTRQ